MLSHVEFIKDHGGTIIAVNGINMYWLLKGIDGKIIIKEFKR